MESVREPRPEDLDSIVNLEHQLSPPKEGQNASRENLNEILSGMLEDKNYSLCVFDIDGKIVGSARLLVEFNLSHGGRMKGHIENVVTDNNFRGKGIGKKMIEYLIEKGREKDCYKVILECKPDEELEKIIIDRKTDKSSNVVFYEKCGMRKTGEIEMRIDL